MGARTFLSQLAVDTVQHQTHGFTDEIDVSTLKDYMKVSHTCKLANNLFSLLITFDTAFWSRLSVFFVSRITEIVKGRLL